MNFPKYPIKTQIILALIFTPLNFLLSLLCTKILNIPLFMDMVFVYAASFFGIPCGIIVGVLYTALCAIVFQHNILHMLYAICCVTGTLLTRLLVTRHEDFSWIRIVILIFVSTVIISFEGSLIYYFFLAGDVSHQEEPIILFLIYNLVLQNIGIQLSAFFARLPVNLFDKAIAVFGGFLAYLGVIKLLKNKK